jgi:peptidoglycan hydrolase CwlO-like protein
MQGNGGQRIFLPGCVLASLILIGPLLAQAQDTAKTAPANQAAADSPDPLRTLNESIRQLQAQVQALTSKLTDLEAAEQSSHEEAKELRRELALTQSQLAASANAPNPPSASSDPQPADGQGSPQSSSAPSTAPE